ncbi:MAG: agmatine deiminase family protein [Pirellulaceae bacterium]|nr:agmatine deiminase family protein [Pirellulaceae bacterium]
MSNSIAPSVRWPAEWEPQTATWISWPHNHKTWPGHFQPVPLAMVRFIEELSKVQRVEVLAGPVGIAPSAAEMLGDMPNVTIHPVVTNDVWIRDFGPTFVRRLSDNALVGVDWHFNAWGGKYPPFDQDAAAAEAICQIVGCPRHESWLVCEGGGLETDGQGTLLTTSSVLMSSTRNPNRSREEVEQELCLQLGVSKIIWVDGGGIEGDDTDGHIDQLARFVSEDTVVVAVSSIASDSNHAGLAENLNSLKRATSAHGHALNVVPLPTPLPRVLDGRRVPESYCNFLIANEIVIVPTFRSDATDRAALRLLEQLMPDRRIVPLDAYDLIWGLGAFHCASQQQP